MLIYARSIKIIHTSTYTKCTFLYIYIFNCYSTAYAIICTIFHKNECKRLVHLNELNLSFVTRIVSTPLSINEGLQVRKGN